MTVSEFLTYAWISPDAWESFYPIRGEKKADSLQKEQKKNQSGHPAEARDRIRAGRGRCQKLYADSAQCVCGSQRSGGTFRHTLRLSAADADAGNFGVLRRKPGWSTVLHKSVFLLTVTFFFPASGTHGMLDDDIMQPEAGIASDEACAAGTAAERQTGITIIPQIGGT